MLTVDVTPAPLSWEGGAFLKPPAGHFLTGGSCLASLCDNLRQLRGSEPLLTERLTVEEFSRR